MMKHAEDNKELGIFTKGDEIVIACKAGHFWVIQAKQLEAGETKRTPQVEDLYQKFPEVEEFLDWPIKLQTDRARPANWFNA